MNLHSVQIVQRHVPVIFISRRGLFMVQTVRTVR